jgi:hypothetical protein
VLDPSGFTLLFSNFADSTKISVEIQDAVGPWRSVIKVKHVGALAGDEAFNKQFGNSPGLVLVRPDGYVAFTGTAESVAKLAGYCDRWLIGSAVGDTAVATHA